MESGHRLSKVSFFMILLDLKTVLRLLEWALGISEQKIMYIMIHLLLTYFFPALDDLKNYLENPDSMVEMKFLLLEQKYLELISKKSTIDALKVSLFLLASYDV